MTDTVESPTEGAQGASSAPAATTSETPSTAPGDAQNASGALFEASVAESSDENSQGDLILNRFKDQAELEKSYTELENLLKTKGYEPPAEYALDEAMETYGWQEEPEAKASFTSFLKEHKFTQKQAEALMGFGSDIIRAEIARSGPAVDVDAERGKLSKELGAGWENHVSEVAAWARANLDAEIFTKPLNQTAAGIKFLKSMMSQNSGAVPITDRPSVSGVDPDELNLKIKEWMSDPEYNKQTAAGKALQNKVYNAFKALERSGRA
jgi:hypothetical protein